MATSGKCAASVAVLERYDLCTRPGRSVDRATAERLARSVWRHELDTGQHTDARMELAFAAEIADLRRSLDPGARYR